ncbi:Hypothetical predicted protein, partial [Pelobates cultripes]
GRPQGTKHADRREQHAEPYAPTRPDRPRPPADTEFVAAWCRSHLRPEPGESPHTDSTRPPTLINCTHADVLNPAR